MAKRKSTGASLRWSVFARDGFTCRYCGAQAGQDGVELACDHVVSVAEGGGTTYDNLVTSCKKCNGGKGAKSLSSVPTSKEIIERLNDRTSTLKAQAKAMITVMRAQEDLEQEATNLKCRAYGYKEVRMVTGEKSRIVNLCRTYGPELVFEWYSSAANRGVTEYNSIRYVHGCVRNYRKQMGLGEANGG